MTTMPAEQLERELLEATAFRTDVPTGAFSRVLIANRGEIALRIVRAAADLGLESVAVYTAADENAAFVSGASQAWRPAGSTPAETYLNRENSSAARWRSIRPGGSSRSGRCSTPASPMCGQLATSPTYAPWSSRRLVLASALLWR